jgi:hypothetical protein
LNLLVTQKLQADIRYQDNNPIWCNYNYFPFLLIRQTAKMLCD